MHEMHEIEWFFLSWNKNTTIVVWCFLNWIFAVTKLWFSTHSRVIFFFVFIGLRFKNTSAQVAQGSRGKVASTQAPHNPMGTEAESKLKRAREEPTTQVASVEGYSLLWSVREAPHARDAHPLAQEKGGVTFKLQYLLRVDSVLCCAHDFLEGSESCDTARARTMYLYTKEPLINNKLIVLSICC